MRDLEHLTKHLMEKIKEKQLFIIDGYRIWAYTYEEAHQNYLQILKF
jgi:CHASE3 domain sensor protein